MDATPPPRLRPRFSLLNLLLLMAVVALSLTVWGEASRRGPLEHEIQMLRREVGEVVVAVPTRMYVKPLANSVDSRMHFRWRAHVPPERAGEVTVEVLQPNKNRKAVLSMTLRAGESGFELVILPSIPSELWMYRLQDPSSGCGGGTSNPAPPWLVKGSKADGLAFDGFDAKPGVAEGDTATLMDLVGDSDDGEPLQVVVNARHYPRGQSPNGESQAGHRKIAVIP